MSNTKISSHATGTVVSGVTIEVISGGSTLSAIIEAKGKLIISSGASSTDTSALSGNEQVYGVATGAVLNGGSQTVFGGGVAYDTVVSAGRQQVNGGIAISAVILDTQLVQSGGVASATTVSSGGQETVKGATTIGTQLAGGAESIQSGGVASNTVISNGGAESVTSATAIGSIILSGGVETVLSTGLASATTISNGGNLHVGVGGSALSTTILSGGIQTVTSGGVAIDTTIAAGATQAISAGAAATGTVVSSGGVFNIQTGTITSDIVFHSGGMIDVTNEEWYKTGSAFVTSGGTVLQIDEATHVELINLSGNYTGWTFSAVADHHGGTLVTVIACYLRGASILTDRGEMAVENLLVGDNLVTLSGEVASLKWIGRRSYAGWLAETNADIQPIRFKAGSLGDNRPNRDLFVSPEHAMYLNGVLIPAKLLVNGISIVVADAMEEVEYYHLELPQHAVIVANGAFSESFVDDDSRGMFHNAHEYAVLYPNEPRSLRAEYCAQRVEDGITLEAVRRELMARAVRLLPDGSLAEAPVLSGNLDMVTPRCVEGWAYENDGAVALAILDNGVVIGHVTADLYRDDLEAAGVGDGCHGFHFALPQGFSDRVDHSIEVRRVKDWSLLNGAPAILKAEVQTGGAHQLLAAE